MPQHMVTVQIAGRFCEYQRADVKAALADVWSVVTVEFLNDHGTLRVSYHPGNKARADLIWEMERALSIGWFCTARIQEAGDEGNRVFGLLDLKR
ncbi:hypothetical protein YTPLAS18_06210 [Nitrospira sp.]|nr:hypothetical protein YTPLAS18_06210 [Nitrospira sp.]